MKLQNTTNIPNKRLRQMIEFVKPKHLETTKFTVKVTNSSKGYCGRYYEEGTGYSKDNRPHIIARITPKESFFPYREEDHAPTKCVKTYYQKFNQKKMQWETWYHRQYIPNPNGNTGNGGYINTLLLSWDEACIHILAHEFRHYWQKTHRTRRGKVWGSRGQYSNRDADAYAVRKVREWRGLQPKYIYPDDRILGH
jgi:hypothetical protein